MNFLCCKEARGPNYCFQYFLQVKEKISQHLPCGAPQPGATRHSSASPTGQQQTLPVSHTTTLPAMTSPLPALQHPKIEGGVLLSGPATLALPPHVNLRPGPPHAALQQHSPLRHRASRGSFPWVSSWRRSTTQMGISTWKNSHGHHPTVPTASHYDCMQPCKAAESLYLGANGLFQATPAPQSCSFPLQGWAEIPSSLIPLLLWPYKLGIVQFKFFNVTCNNRCLFRQRCYV